MQERGNPTPHLSRRLALAFVRGGEAGRVHSSFGIGLAAVTLTVALLVLTFGIYDSYAAKLETIALSVYPHVVVIDRADEPERPEEGDEAAASAARCRRICRGDVILARRDEAGAGSGRAPVARLGPIREAVRAAAPGSTVAPLVFEEASFAVRLGGAAAPPRVRRLRVLGVETGNGRFVPEVDRFVPRPLLERLAAAPSAVLVSESLARELWGTAAAAGRGLALERADGRGGPAAGAHRLEVAGTFALGFHSLAENLVITSLAGAQALLGMPGEASYFGVGLADAYRSAEVCRTLQRPLGAAGFTLSDWMGIAGGDFTNIRLFRSILLVVLGMSLVITALGIRNTLTIVTVERRRQIGILRALGLPDGPIRRVFLWIALGLAGAGTLAGLPLGTLGSMAFGRWLDHSLADLLPIQGVEVGVQPLAMAQVAALVLAAGAVTALLSVRRALALDPVTCLAAE